MIAQREINRSQGGGPQGGHGGMGGMDRMGPGPNGPMINIPPSLMNNPNIPNEIIYGLQAGRIGNTVFVANVRLPKCLLLKNKCQQVDQREATLTLKMHCQKYINCIHLSLILDICCEMFLKVEANGW